MADAMPNPPPPDWGKLDKQHVWHPFTPMQPWLASDNIVIESGEGFELIDTRGRRFIDGFSSLWCNLHGHRVKAIDDAIGRQLGRIAHSTLLGFASIPSIELAERLVRLAPPGLTKAFFSDSGATAVEVALKMAYQYYQNIGCPRKRFIALREGYHGDTIGSVSVGGVETFHRLFRPLLFETTFVDSPNPYHHPAGNGASEAVLAEIETLLARAADEYCAVILEPLIQAAAGMFTHSPAFLRALRELTRRHGVLLIADEVATGFCRTGTMFACEQAAITPDLMCLGKGLTGGYLPVAATLATQEIFDAFLGPRHEGRTFFHGHTFTGNALGCAAAVASIDLIASAGLLAALPAKIEFIRSSLAPLADHPHVGDIRQCGMMVGIELMADRAARRAFDPRLRIGESVCRAALERGLIIRPLDDIVVLMPAPAMDAATLARMMAATLETIHDYFRNAAV